MRHFRSFFRDNFRPEEDNDVISGGPVEVVGRDVCVKFGDYRSNRFRDIRAAHFVMVERRRAGPVVIGRTPYGVLLTAAKANSINNKSEQ